MNIALWIVQALLALAFIMAGSMKLFQPITTLSKNLTWAGELPAWQVRGIGLAELLGGLGLILPGVTHIATWLTPVAALGLVITMLLAVIFHLVRRETPRMAPSLILGLLTLAVFYGRFALLPLN